MIAKVPPRPLAARGALVVLLFIGLGFIASWRSLRPALRDTSRMSVLQEQPDVGEGQVRGPAHRSLAALRKAAREGAAAPAHVIAHHDVDLQLAFDGHLAPRQADGRTDREVASAHRDVHAKQQPTEMQPNTEPVLFRLFDPTPFRVDVSTLIDGTSASRDPSAPSSSAAQMVTVSGLVPRLISSVVHGRGGEGHKSSSPRDLNVSQMSWREIVAAAPWMTKTRFHFGRAVDATISAEHHKDSATATRHGATTTGGKTPTGKGSTVPFVRCRLLSAAKPRILHFPQFLSVEEAEALIAVGATKLQRSGVASKTKNYVRSSSGMRLPSKHPLVRIIDRKILATMQRQFSGAISERLYLLRYVPGESYVNHMDSFGGIRGAIARSAIAKVAAARARGLPKSKWPPQPTDRGVTFLIYLRAPVRGGNTTFPKLSPQELLKRKEYHDALEEDRRVAAAFASIGQGERKSARAVDSALTHDERDVGVESKRRGEPNGWRGHGLNATEQRIVESYAKGFKKDCDPSKAFGFAPKTGDAVAFYDMRPDGVEDPWSHHCGCPVLEGEKWMLTKWLHVPFPA